MDTLSLMARVNRKDIAYVSHIIESYEGLAVVNTIDPASGLIRITISPFCFGEVKDILNQLMGEVELKLLNGQQ